LPLPLIHDERTKSELSEWTNLPVPHLTKLRLWNNYRENGRPVTQARNTDRIREQSQIGTDFFTSFQFCCRAEKDEMANKNSPSVIFHCVCKIAL